MELGGASRNSTGFGAMEEGLMTSCLITGSGDPKEEEEVEEE